MIKRSRLPNNKERRSKVLQKRADRLNRICPSSEKWFWFLWKKKCFHNIYDVSNVPFGYYIFDVLNEHYKYAIEIDGISHNTVFQKDRDKKKDRFCYINGYKIFRIESKNFKCFMDVAKEVMEHRRIIDRMMLDNPGFSVDRMLRKNRKVARVIVSTSTGSHLQTQKGVIKAPATVTTVGSQRAEMLAQ